MALQQKLSLKLAQRLVMTPSLQQAIKLLQMTRMELQTTLAQELVENPVLDEFEDATDEPQEQAEAAGEEAAEAEPSDADSLSEIDLEAYFRDQYESSSGPSTYEHREAPPLENTLTREPDLYDHLLWQLHMLDLPAREREIAELIIGNLNPDGFLVATLDEIARMGAEDGEGVAYPYQAVEKALATVRDLEPPGIAYHDLRESLLRQLEAVENEHEELARRVIEEHWEAFLRRQFQAIAKALEVELADLQPVVDLIRTLETRPGRRFNSDRAHYIEPDVAVVKVGEEYVVQVNDDGMPKLRISRAYRNMLKSLREDKSNGDAKQFLNDKMRSAIWLIKSLDQRQRTIYKVAESIVRQQRAFLDHGIDAMRPMVLRDVADDIGMHESTVSRVVSNKYIHTPRGVLPMKFFFHSGIDREYGEDISSLTVKRKIKQLIEAEDPERPLSDSGLTKILKREGINIARRTVAKYRDELDIPSSNARKRIF